MTLAKIKVVNVCSLHYGQNFPPPWRDNLQWHLRTNLGYCFECMNAWESHENSGREKTEIFIVHKQALVVELFACCVRASHERTCV